MRSAFLNIFWQYTLQALNVVIPLLTFKIIIDRISFSQFGELALILVIINYAKVFLDFGFSIKGPVLLNESEKKGKNLIQDISNILFCKIIISFFILLILLVVSIFIDVYIVMVFLILFFFAFNMNYYFNYKEKSKILTFISLFEKLTFFCLIYFIFNEQNYFETYLLFLLISSFISAFLNLYFISKNEKKPIFKIIIPQTKFKLIYYASSGSHQFLINIANGLFTYSIIPIVTYFFGSYQAGIYASAEKLIKACQLLVSPLISGIQKFLLNNVTKKKLLVLFLFGVFVFSILSFVVFYYSEYLSGLIIDNEINLVSEITSILSISILASFMFTFCNVILLNKINNESHLKYLFLFIYLIGIILFIYSEQTDLIYFAWEIFVLELIILLYTTHIALKKIFFSL